MLWLTPSKACCAARNVGLNTTRSAPPPAVSAMYLLKRYLPQQARVDQCQMARQQCGCLRNP
eukprot:2963852-Lingulodinium_polyedra.AAC.1